ncbi:hypothetical protein HDV06_002316 [Boothiomyces sp. JEL0866]|nr:hypothetical protein HDV06_002316 [Boothiomyces sp. JEL0866]
MWTTRKQSLLIAAINRNNPDYTDILKLKITVTAQLEYAKEIFEMLIKKKDYVAVEKLLVILENSEKDIVGKYGFELLDQLFNTPVFMRLIYLSCHLITKSINNKLLLYENNQLIIKISSKMNQNTVQDQIKILELLFRLSRKNTCTLPGMQRIEGNNFLNSAREFINDYNEKEKIDLCSIWCDLTLFKKDHSTIQYTEIIEYTSNTGLVQIRLDRTDYKSINFTTKAVDVLCKVLQKKKIPYINNRGSFTTCMINRTAESKEYNDNWISESVLDLMQVNEKTAVNVQESRPVELAKDNSDSINTNIQVDEQQLDEISPIRHKNQDSSINSSIFSDEDSESEYIPSQSKSKQPQRKANPKNTVKSKKIATEIGNDPNHFLGTKNLKTKNLLNSEKPSRLLLSKDLNGQRADRDQAADFWPNISTSTPVKKEEIDQSQIITPPNLKTNRNIQDAISTFETSATSKAKFEPSKKRAARNRKVKSNTSNVTKKTKQKPVRSKMQKSEREEPQRLHDVNPTCSSNILSVKQVSNQSSPMKSGKNKQFITKTPITKLLQSASKHTGGTVKPIPTPVILHVSPKNCSLRISNDLCRNKIKQNLDIVKSKRSSKEDDGSSKKIKITPISNLKLVSTPIVNLQPTVPHPFASNKNTEKLATANTPENRKVIQLDFSITPTNPSQPIITDFELSQIALEISKVYQAYVENAMKEVYTRVQCIEQDSTIITKIKDHVQERIEKTLELKKSLERICNEIKSL